MSDTRADMHESGPSRAVIERVSALHREIAEIGTGAAPVPADSAALVDAGGTDSGADAGLPEGPRGSRTPPLQPPVPHPPVDMSRVTPPPPPPPKTQPRIWTWLLVAAAVAGIGVAVRLDGIGQGDGQDDGSATSVATGSGATSATRAGATSPAARDLDADRARAFAELEALVSASLEQTSIALPHRCVLVVTTDDDDGELAARSSTATDLGAIRGDLLRTALPDEVPGIAGASPYLMRIDGRVRTDTGFLHLSDLATSLADDLRDKPEEALDLRTGCDLDARTCAIRMRTQTASPLTTMLIGKRFEDAGSAASAGGAIHRLAETCRADIRASGGQGDAAAFMRSGDVGLFGLAWGDSIGADDFALRPLDFLDFADDDPAARARFLARYANEPGPPLDDALTMVYDLPWYPTRLFVAVRDRSRGKLLAAVETPDGDFLRLQGPGGDIHGLNRSFGLALDDAGTLDYLRFFNFFVNSELGGFVIVDDPHDVAVASVPDAVPRAIERPACEPQVAGRIKCTADVAYGENLFGARYDMTADGMVEMLGDEIIAPLEVPMTWSVAD